ncbi:hypothetical protein H5410_030059 [Solanum commersonii]|uniref:Uncharacterized protein n=1 Tax=Solanum commersonii TaxID=4109 RepID=A0A9J5YEJ8_SOLCO|nr:hypothetical protein H5410_030059 [Solanum commersonii]
MPFGSCGDCRVSIWHCDRLVHPTSIGHQSHSRRGECSKDPCREPRVRYLLCKSGLAYIVA